MRDLPWIILLTLIFLTSAVTAGETYTTRGNDANIILQPVNENTTIGSCWYFPENGLSNSKLYDIPSIKYNNYYVCNLPGELNKEMPKGRYTLIYEILPIINNKTFKDISWKDGSLVSIFSESKPIKESGMQAQTIMEDLINKLETNGINQYNKEQVIIQEPELSVKDFEKASAFLYDIDPAQKNLETILPLIPIPSLGKYRLSGTCNLPDGTVITIKIDEDRYFAQHNDSFTFTTKLIRDETKPSSSWFYDMPLAINDMPPGWHDITVYAGSLVSTRKFKIDIGIVPTPTPTEYVSYLSSGNIAPVYVRVVEEKIVDNYIDRWHTATPTPAITDALGENIDYPYKTGGQLPGWVALLSLIGIAGLVLVRDWKWKK